jgi:uncharacterized phage-like protein YoqJ
MIIAGTGHRPAKLIARGVNAYRPQVFFRLVDLAYAALVRYQPSEVISGMALGWDQALALAASQLGIPFVAYVPFRGQESKWPEASQEQYRELLNAASSAVIVCAGGYAPSKMARRNAAMVNDTDLVLALWDGSSGGTGNCVRYAESKKVPVVNLWSSWMKYA